MVQKIYRERDPELDRITGMSRSQRHRARKAGTFPNPDIEISSGIRGYTEGLLTEWQADRIAATAEKRAAA